MLSSDMATFWVLLILRDFLAEHLAKILGSRRLSETLFIPAPNQHPQMR
jgi:hypothetical protein